MPLRGFSLAVLAVLSGVLMAVSPVSAGDLYCGEKNCYDLLNVSDRSASASDIKKAFYRVSLALHPDKNKAPGAEAAYRDVVNAYEVLSDPVSRANYDDALANPDRFFTNTYQYYQYRAGLHQTALWKVLVGFLSFCTAMHYLYWYHRWHQLHRMVRASPQVQKRMREAVLAAHPELAAAANTRGDSSAVLAAEKQIDALVAAEDIKNHVAINGWEVLPGWRDLLVFQLVFRYPKAIAANVAWLVRWQWRYSIHSMPYAAEDEPYATALALRIEWDRWLTIPEPERQRFVEQKLWIPANMKEFRREIISGRKKKW